MKGVGVMQSDNIASWILILVLSFCSLSLIRNKLLVAGILLTIVISLLVIEQVMTLIERRRYF